MCLLIRNSMIHYALAEEIFSNIESAVSCDYLCIFQQRAPEDGYVIQFCKQYLDRLYACLDVIKVLIAKRVLICFSYK